MVRHWVRTREAGWWWRAMVNAFGCVLTLVVLVDRRLGKFAERRLARGRPHPDPRGHDAVHPTASTAVGPAAAGGPPGLRARCRPIARSGWSIPIPGITRAVVQAVNVGRSIIRGRPGRVHLGRSGAGQPDARAAGSARSRACRSSSSSRPTGRWSVRSLAYLDVLDRAWPPDKPEPITFVVIPEYVARHWWERILYNQSSKRLRTILIGRPHTVVVSAPYRRDEEARFDQSAPGRLKRAVRARAQAPMRGGIVHAVPDHPRTVPFSARRPGAVNGGPSRCPDRVGSRARRLGCGQGAS